MGDEELTENLSEELSEEELESIFSGPLLGEEDLELHKSAYRGSSLTRLAPLSSVAISIADRKRLNVDAIADDALTEDAITEEEKLEEAKIEEPVVDVLSEEDRKYSPEDLQERIEKFKSNSKRRGSNHSLQAAGVVLSFGFTVAAVIWFFWWLAGQLVTCTGCKWIEGPMVVVGVVVGLLSGLYMLVPYAHEKSKVKKQ